MEYTTNIYFTDKYHDFVQKENYELFIYNVMKKSNAFTGKYIKDNSNQSRSESDYYDINGKPIDVKIIFESKLIASLASKNLEGFAEEVKKQLSIVTDATLDGLEDNELFINLKEILINKIDDDEDCILFCPIPSELDYRNSYVLGHGQDNISICYSVLRSKYPNKLANKRVYYITFTFNNLISVKCISNGVSSPRDYLICNELSKYVGCK